MDKYLFLEATEYNWSMMGPGSWNHSTWQVFNDGSYFVSNHFNSKDGDWDSNPEIRKRTGVMKPKALEKLISATKKKWHTDEEPYDVCDGVAWEFKMYNSSGKTLKHWKEGRIYGHSIMEEIEAALPPLTTKDTKDW